MTAPQTADDVECSGGRLFLQLGRTVAAYNQEEMAGGAEHHLHSVLKSSDESISLLPALPRLTDPMQSKLSSAEQSRSVLFLHRAEVEMLQLSMTPLLVQRGQRRIDSGCPVPCEQLMHKYG
jgi:hypothetical protein